MVEYRISPQNFDQAVGWVTWNDTRREKPKSKSVEPIIVTCLYITTVVACHMSGLWRIRLSVRLCMPCVRFVITRQSSHTRIAA